jgi:glucokinase
MGANTMNQSLLGALDIGGTKIAASVANIDGPLARVTAPTPKSGALDTVARQCVAMLHAACDQAGVPRAAVQAVGVASAGPFAQLDGMLGLATPNICGGQAHSADLPNDWEVIPLERTLREQFAHVVIENDCVSALVAERAFGAVRDEPDCVYVTWSTGIGFGFCVDGRVLHGKHGNAGHSGHMLMSESSDALCGCGNRGDLEALISGRNLANRLGQSTADVFDAARNGEPDARAIAHDAARWFGRGLYNVAVALDTRMFVVGGSVWQHHGDWLLPMVRAELASRMHALTDGVEIVPAALGSLVADIGAFAQVMPSEWMRAWHDSQPWQALK